MFSYTLYLQQISWVRRRKNNVGRFNSVGVEWGWDKRESVDSGKISVIDW